MYGGQKVHTEFWWEDLRERNQLEDLRVDDRIILKWKSTKWDGEAWTDCSARVWGQVAGAGGCGNEPLIQ